MPRSMRFAKHLLIAAVGATLDYLVGRLTNRLSWGIATWAAIVLVASALIDYLNEAPNSRPDWGEGGSLLSAVRTYMGPYRRPTIFRAAMAGLCAAVASCALTLAVITFRFCADHGTAWLGKGSPFDESVAVFVGNFQASSPTVWLMATCSSGIVHSLATRGVACRGGHRGHRQRHARWHPSAVARQSRLV